jgi:hypothetical protein
MCTFTLRNFSCTLSYNSKELKKNRGLPQESKVINGKVAMQWESAIETKEV